MRVVVVAPPPGPLLDAPTVRLRLGIGSSAGDANLVAFIQAATDELDGPHGWLGRAIGLQTLEMQGSYFPGPYGGPSYCGPWPWPQGYDGFGSVVPGAIRLPYPEIVSITSVTYLDATGAQQVVDPATYTLVGRELVPLPGMSWPSASFQPGSVKIRYQAGYTTVPSAISQAIVMRVGQMSSMMRPDLLLKSDSMTGVGSQQWDTSGAAAETIDGAVSRLLAPFRVID